jgi:predicted DNA-binding transcriptional regulator AlpA
MSDLPQLEDVLLDERAAARFLAVTPRTLQNWRQKRIGPRWYAYSSRCVRYRRSDLDAWLATRTATLRAG